MDFWAKVDQNARQMKAEINAIPATDSPSVRAAKIATLEEQLMERISQSMD